MTPWRLASSRGRNENDTGPGRRANMAAMKVLVVDDSVDAAETLGLLVQAWGHETQLAYDGAEAIEAVQRWSPDVVLLDIGLPVVDGYEVARRLRADSVQAVL